MADTTGKNYHSLLKTSQQQMMMNYWFGKAMEAHVVSLKVNF